MSRRLSYTIGNESYEFSVEGSPEFKCGKNERLSREDTDIVYHQDWYQEGYTVKPFLSESEFAYLKEGLTNSVAALIREELNLEVPADFVLENYHHLVKNSEDHYKVVRRTRDLFAEDFNFPVKSILPKFEAILGFGLTDINPEDGKELHIIVRINRPGSNDFNPPHKDVYERVDEANYIPPFVNLWIPIAGVTENSSLPIAPGSHLISEDQVCRTFDGAVVEGNKYRVRMIESWGGSTHLERAKVKDGDVLFFSGHLIHGLAVNAEPDMTRVALEFRLFKKD
ncbi:phytanoyl-CoA dioxygenase family protein [Leadbetterella byssophila]|jgi:hypothetical protein|uniref:Phytanoyl-CoA dioxygenase n=1 Tax=Leadbetterella byssophila (strain DSM 17132 / JCM 16389 / KACC 11308 / NBRC 106382 / 4M15) TaxID=649349 RepID=E4RSC2_LEAB4|nr:phytanoyl-CoA dioxygenase family protein [Leadbetterella byssophila]ADQ17658.1 Phytanoyl-CoA dioxygenase [Leadbetterella byssophila DSM 17132]